MKPNLATDFAREVKEGVADIAGVLWKLASNPAHLRESMGVWKQTRQDAAVQTRLNRQIRSQFMLAFNRSARKKMSVEVNEEMARYQSRNKLLSALLRPYEIFSYWNLPSKIVTAAVFFKTVRTALWPAMGPWGIIVPLAAFVGARMAVVYRNSENKRQEEKLSAEGLTVPCNFDVKQGKAFVTGVEITHGTTMGFPVMHVQAPQWVAAKYDGDRKALTKPQAVHAAAFEAMRLNRLSTDDVEKIEKTFSKDEQQRNGVYALSVIFPDRGVDDLIKDASQGAVLNVLEPFCLKMPSDAGLAVLAGRVSMEDIDYLVELKSLGITPDTAQARNITRMLEDPRFSDTLSFRQKTEAALLPAPQAAAFDDLWKDRAYRTRFSYEQLRDVTLNAEGWGSVALRLAQHDYTKGLSGAQIIELAMPENEHWAMAYHSLRVDKSGVLNTTAHDDLKKAVQEFGLMADKALSTPLASATVLRH